jgi:hypothetical protein
MHSPITPRLHYDDWKITVQVKTAMLGKWDVEKFWPIFFPPLLKNFQKRRKTKREKCSQGRREMAGSFHGPRMHLDVHWEGLSLALHYRLTEC